MEESWPIASGNTSDQQQGYGSIIVVEEGAIQSPSIGAAVDRRSPGTSAHSYLFDAFCGAWNATQCYSWTRRLLSLVLILLVGTTALYPTTTTAAATTTEGSETPNFGTIYSLLPSRSEYFKSLVLIWDHYHHHHHRHYDEQQQEPFQQQCIFTNVVCEPNPTKTEVAPPCFVSPTEYESCLSSIVLEKEHVLQTISSLDEIFRQYYPFYYTARNPKNSSGSSLLMSSSNYQRIYDRPYDLHAQLQQIQSRIQANGASSITDFWNVTAVFNVLRDAHVNALQGNLGSLRSSFISGRYELVVKSQSEWEAMAVQDNQQQLIQTIFYYDQEGRIAMELLEAVEERGEEEDVGIAQGRKAVARINGQSVHDFLLGLTESPMASIALKSVGPRINALMTRNFPTGKPADWFFRTRPGRLEQIWPHAIVPESFVVEYDTGDQEIFVSKIVWSASDRQRLLGEDEEARTMVLYHSHHHGNNILLDTLDITQKANQPSDLCQHFQLGADIIQKHGASLLVDKRGRVAKEERTTPRQLLSKTSRHALKLKQDSSREIAPVNIKDVCVSVKDTWFDKAYNCSNFEQPYEEDGPFAAAFKVVKDALIFKIDSFDAPPELFVALWREIVLLAKKINIHRLLIDISDNGGGEVPAGLDLARLMYPEVKCEHFNNPYDTVYNDPMRAWAEIVEPILNSIEANWEDQIITEKQWKNLTTRRHKQTRRGILALAEAMCILDLDHSSEHHGDDVEAFVAANCSLYMAAKKSMQKYPYWKDFMAEYLAAMNKSNPWTVAIEIAGVPVHIGERQQTRGGTVANFTGFLPHEPDYPNYWNCSEMRLLDENPFLSYVLVGNGNSGSTANTFQTTVENIWKHRSLSEAKRPLVSVSYGGIAEDTPLTSFAGGTVVGRTNVEAPHVGLAGLHLLSKVLLCIDGDDKDESGIRERTLQAILALEMSLPEVPYHLQKFPKLPAFEIYNCFNLNDNGEAMPQEFINMAPDVRLQEFFFGTIFDGPGSSRGKSERPLQLEDLYDKSVGYFQG